MPPETDSANAAEPPEGETDERLIARLRAGDEAAFTELVVEYQPALLRFARLYVSTQELAEDVAQETWMGVLNGIDRFEGRSSLKTWIFRIAANRAQTRGKREARTIPFAVLAAAQADGEEPALDIERFLPRDHPTSPGHWTALPRNWDDQPEERLLAGETLRLIRETIDTLPETQATVITLRDIEQWSSAEVCEALQISEANQRVLLHRARAKVRRALEPYLEATGVNEQ
jgi:RNA polymerase sigma-70 factor (ECF subfamily)